MNSNQRQNFFRRSEEMFRLYGQGNFGEALAVAERLALEFPDEAASTDFWRVCLLSVSGNPREALDSMKRSVDNGMWWSEAQLRADSDLAALQGDPQFETLVALCKERQAAAQATTKPSLLLIQPQGDGPHPLLIALHARGSSPERDASNWEPLVARGWVLAMPQSSQPGSPNSYVWDDTERAMAEIQTHYLGLLEQLPLDRSCVILGGLSQGAALSMLLALDRRIPARGFLAVSPGGPTLEQLEPAAKAVQGRKPRGYVVVGGRDFQYEKLKEIPKRLRANDVPCVLEEHPNMGHEFPVDFEQTLTKALRFLFDESEQNV